MEMCEAGTPSCRWNASRDGDEAKLAAVAMRWRELSMLNGATLCADSRGSCVARSRAAICTPTLTCSDVVASGDACRRSRSAMARPDASMRRCSSATAAATGSPPSGGARRTAATTPRRLALNVSRTRPTCGLPRYAGYLSSSTANATRSSPMPPRHMKGCDVPAHARPCDDLAYCTAASALVAASARSHSARCAAAPSASSLPPDASTRRRAAARLLTADATRASVSATAAGAAVRMGGGGPPARASPALRMQAIHLWMLRICTSSPPPGCSTAMMPRAAYA